MKIELDGINRMNVSASYNICMRPKYISCLQTGGNAVVLLQHFASRFICLPPVNALYDAFQHFPKMCTHSLPIVIHFHICVHTALYA